MYVNNNEFYSVKDVARKIKKNEETVKRWLRNEKKKSELFPNAYKNSDKEGWRIPQSDMETVQLSQQTSNENTPYHQSHQDIQEDIEKLIILAYQAVTLSHPPKELVSLFVPEGIGRTLECLLVMQQSPTKVKNPVAFLKKCVTLGWTPETTAVKMPRKKGKRLYDLTQNDDFYQQTAPSNQNTRPIPFYNWLEE